MRLHKHLSARAAAATLAGVVTPVAHASDIGEGGGGQLPVPAAPQHVVSTSHHSDSTDWALIALAGGGAVALVGAGLGGSRQLSRRRASAGDVRAPHAA